MHCPGLRDVHGCESDTSLSSSCDVRDSCESCTGRGEAYVQDVACEALRIFQGRGIAFVSVSQSEALEEFHTQKLRLGEPSADGWSLAPIDSEAVEEQAQGDDGS